MTIEILKNRQEIYMILKEMIQSIFDDNVNYVNPTQAVNQASSLDALSDDLYTDSTRFIYELLQNADDSSTNEKGVKVWIKVFEDNLLIAHSGAIFNSDDVRGICNINNGTKKSDINKTGYKGIGFKSVFGQSRNVTIYTNKEYFKFDSTYEHKWRWDESQEKWEKRNQRKFQFPWQIIPIYLAQDLIPKSINQYLNEIGANVATIIKLENLSDALESINKISENPNLFLFLKNITQINFDLEEPTIISINRSLDSNISLIKDGEQVGNWLIKTTQLEVPEKINKILKNENNIPEKLKQAKSIEMTLAVKLNTNGIIHLNSEEKILYSYLPTDERNYPLPILVNTNFLTSANRESIHENSKWNSWIFEEIPVEIFKWISELRLSRYGSQAYKLLPGKLPNRNLGESFNKGIEEALRTVKFIMSEDNLLTLVNETIIDYTLLVHRQFFSDFAIKNFVAEPPKNRDDISKKHFAIDSDYFAYFDKLGAKTFRWEDLKTFLLSREYLESYSFEKNVELLLVLREIYLSESDYKLPNKEIEQLAMIMDHKGNVKIPSRVCFPEFGDLNWDSSNSELSFIHPELLNLISDNFEIRSWLERLGMKEKTDISFISQIIIPNIDTCTTKENAIELFIELFNLYKKESLNNEILKQLSSIKLLTKAGTLLPAEKCYFSDYYNPHLRLEKLIDLQNIISDSYCENPNEKDEIKDFLKRLGVKERISKKNLPNRYIYNKCDLINEKYFLEEDKKFEGYYNSFVASEYSNIVTLDLLDQTIDNYSFSYAFWSDYINNYTPEEISQPAIAFWGYKSYSGWNTGKKVENYMPWAISQLKVLPTKMGCCESRINIFLNTDEIINIGAKYLPIFDGPELSDDWRAFFKFKSNLELSDLLCVLEKISSDLNNAGKNSERIQSIYTIMLDNCINWGNEDKNLVRAYAESNKLMNTENTFNKCEELKCFIDGNELLFQNEYSFIFLNMQNKKNKNLEIFLDCFGIQILEKKDFKLISSDNAPAIDLKKKLFNIAPLLIHWINSGPVSIKLELGEFNKMIENLDIFQSDFLEISYSEINFRKEVNTHFNNSSLYVSKPWYSNRVWIDLPTILCKYLQIVGNEERLGFLLRSPISEITQYFEQEKIMLPEELENYLKSLDYSDNLEKTEMDLINDRYSKGNIHESDPDYDKYIYIERLVQRSVKNVISHLQNLAEYDCSGQFKIANSIIGGIKKDGVDITIVARPSDNEKVILFYDSEFDVLNYANSELWYEDGNSIPKKMTLGQVLIKSKINKISVPKIEITTQEENDFLKERKSNVFETSPIPYTPEKLSKVIASFANTEGGRLIFGIKENTSVPNEVIGISLDYKLDKILEKTMSNFKILPKIEWDWIKVGEKLLFIIEVQKSETDIFYNEVKYIRTQSEIISEEDDMVEKQRLAKANYNNTKAIIIAIEQYNPSARTQVQNVKYAREDAYSFKKMLQESMGVRDENINLYIDEDAFANKLKNELKDIINNLNADDRLIFYYAGHGFHDGLSNYLSTYDIYPLDIVGSSLSLNEILLDPLKQSKCKNALIFIDACAQKIVSKNARTVISNIKVDDFSIITHSFPYYAMFLSCQIGESSFGSDNLNHGIWTFHLVEAMNGRLPKIMKKKNYLTDLDLQKYLSEAVPKTTMDELGKQQNPKTILDSHCENIINIFKK